MAARLVGDRIWWHFPRRHGRGDRVAEGTRLLSGRRSKACRGFESRPLRKDFAAAARTKAMDPRWRGRSTCPRPDVVREHALRELPLTFCPSRELPDLQDVSCATGPSCEHGRHSFSNDRRPDRLTVAIGKDRQSDQRWGVSRSGENTAAIALDRSCDRRGLLRRPRPMRASIGQEDNDDRVRSPARSARNAPMTSGRSCSLTP